MDSADLLKRINEGVFYTLMARNRESNERWSDQDWANTIYYREVYKPEVVK